VASKALEKAGQAPGHAAAGGYMLGPRLLELGSAYLRTVDVLQDFRDSCRTGSQETLLLATLDDLDVLYLARHDGTQPVRLGSDIGRRLPAVGGSPWHPRRGGGDLGEHGLPTQLGDALQPAPRFVDAEVHLQADADDAAHASLS
jgi:hypothetical protein